MAAGSMIDQVRMAASRLSPREQALLGGACGALVLLLVTLGVVSVRGSLAEAESRISVKQEGLAQVLQFSSGYREAEAGRRRLESKLRGAGNVSLVSVMEELARGQGVSIAKMTPRRPATKEGITETAVDVSLEPLPIDKLSAILNGLARTKGVVKVSKLRLRKKFNEKEKVDATFTLASYTLEGK
ncbi:MAG: type II secretion system protein GspM [Deltaproteobacteria bacterium]|nr:type II secretion system protein GspM [Deltaproteobacteria bacterium]